MFISDDDCDTEEMESAEDYVLTILSDWIEAGNSPASILNAMRNMLVDIVENVSAKPH